MRKDVGGEEALAGTAKDELGARRREDVAVTSPTRASPRECLSNQALMFFDEAQAAAGLVVRWSPRRCPHGPT